MFRPYLRTINRILNSLDLTDERILAENVEIPEPLFRDAKLDFDYDVVQEPGAPAQFMVDKQSAKLELPSISKVDADRLPEKFDLTLEQEVEDVYARKGRIRFKIEVTVKNKKEKENGLVDLDFDAAVKETEDVSRI